MNIGFFVNSLLLGVGLAMDAFSVSLANGLNEPCMKKGKTLAIAGTFGFFQALMPMLGWLFVHTLISVFAVLNRFVPWIALALLSFIGVKMIVEGVKNKECDCKPALGFSALLVQGVATSIDALSVGFTIASHTLVMALVSSLIIMAVTFALCIVGVLLGKKFGTVFAGKASIIGGVILVLIGIEICISSFLG